MLETRDRKRPLLHQKKAILFSNSTCATYNVILHTLALRIFTFVIYSVRQICARRHFALATSGGTLHTILSTNAPHTTPVRRPVASD